MSAVQPRPTPDSADMQMIGMTIATQAKRDPGTHGVNERWVQTIGVEDKQYKVSVQGPKGTSDKRHRSMKTMILYTYNPCTQRLSWPTGQYHIQVK